MNLSELACATRLFLMAVIRTGRFRNRLTIRDLRLQIFDRQFIIILDSPFQCTKMELTLTGNDCLLQFLGLLDYPCRVFLAHTYQDFHHLLGVSLIHRLDSTTIFRIRIFNEVETIITTLSVQCITTANIL